MLKEIVIEPAPTAKEEKKAQLSTAPLNYELFCKHLRRVPSEKTEALHKQYLADYYSGKETIIIKQIKQRLLATDLVSSLNQQLTPLLPSIRKYLYTKLSESLVKQIIDMLQNKTRIVMKFIPQNIESLDYVYLANLPEYGKDHSSRTVDHLKDTRRIALKYLYKNVETNYEKVVLALFEENPHSVPRYASLAFCDYNLETDFYQGYGKSFIVFKSAALFNSTYTPGDSTEALCNYLKKEPDAQPLHGCTFHTFEYLLTQCTSRQLHNLLQRAQATEIKREHVFDYIEAQIPGYSLSPDLIQHIHINIEAKLPTPPRFVEFQRLLKPSIPVTISTSLNPYLNFSACVQAIKANKEVEYIVKNFQAYFNMYDAYGESNLLDYAIKFSHINLIEFFISLSYPANMMSIIRLLSNIICETNSLHHCLVNFDKNLKSLKFEFEKFIHPAQTNIIPFLLGDPAKKNRCAMTVSSKSFRHKLTNYMSLGDIMLALLKRELYTILVCGQNTYYLLNNNAFHPKTGKGATCCDLILRNDALKLDDGIIESLRWSPTTRYITLQLKSHHTEEKKLDSQSFINKATRYLRGGLDSSMEIIFIDFMKYTIELRIPLEKLLWQMWNQRINYQSCIVENPKGQVAMALRRDEHKVYGLTPAGGHNSDPYPIIPGIPPVSVLNELQEEFGFIPKSDYQTALTKMILISITDKVGVFAISSNEIKLHPSIEPYCREKKLEFKAESFEYKPETAAFYDLNSSALRKHGLRNLHGLEHYCEYIEQQIIDGFTKLGFSVKKKSCHDCALLPPPELGEFHLMDFGKIAISFVYARQFQVVVKFLPPDFCQILPEINTLVIAQTNHLQVLAVFEEKVFAHIRKRRIPGQQSKVNLVTVEDLKNLLSKLTRIIESEHSEEEKIISSLPLILLRLFVIIALGALGWFLLSKPRNQIANQYQLNCYNFTQNSSIVARNSSILDLCPSDLSTIFPNTTSCSSIVSNYCDLTILPAVFGSLVCAFIFFTSLFLKIPCDAHNRAPMSDSDPKFEEFLGSNELRTLKSIWPSEWPQDLKPIAVDSVATTPVNRSLVRFFKSEVEYQLNQHGQLPAPDTGSLSTPLLTLN